MEVPILRKGIAGPFVGKREYKRSKLIRQKRERFCNSNMDSPIRIHEKRAILLHSESGLLVSES